SRERVCMSDLDAARQRYAELIRKNALLHSEPLVRALAEVPREKFLGPGPWKILRRLNLTTYEDTPDDDPVHLYDDVLVAIDITRRLNNGLPSGVAAWMGRL